MNLAEGQIRATYRHGNQKLEPMKPAEIYQFSIHLGATSNLSKKDTVFDWIYRAAISRSLRPIPAKHRFTGVGP